MGEAVKYDASKDKVLYQKFLEPDGKTGVEFAVCSYDDGPPKIKIQRYGVKKSGEKYYLPKSGRLSLREMQQITDAFKTWKASK